MSLAEVPFVKLPRYNIGRIKLVNSDLIEAYADAPEIDGTETWPRFLDTLNIKVEQQLGQYIPILNQTSEQKKNFKLQAKGIILSFSGYQALLPVICHTTDGDRVIYQPREPRFVIEEKFEDLSVLEERKLMTANYRILDTMRRKYPLKVSFEDPPTLIFPMEEFANVTIFPSTVDIGKPGA